MEGKEIEYFSSTILLINTQFFFNEVINFSHLRASLLNRRAKKRLEEKDAAAAATDSNEALNYDNSLTECYLLKARAEKEREGYYKAVIFYELYLSMGKQCAEYETALEELNQLKKIVNYKVTHNESG